MKKIITMVAVIFLCGALMALSPLVTESDPDDSGEDNADTNEDNLITFVVPFEAGGGTDIYGRFMTPYFSKHLEGDPRVQVENVPGGASITGTNEYANSRTADGSNILTSSASSHVPYMLEQSSVDYDLGEFKPLVGSPSGGVVYTTPEKAEKINNGIGNIEEELHYAGISPTGLDLTTLLSYEVLGLDINAVLGYEGRGPSRVAFDQGESNIDFQTTTAYNNNVLPMVENGEAVPLYSLGQIDESGDLVRDPEFPELPTVEEVYIDQYGEKPSGKEWEVYKQMVNASYTMNKAIWIHDDAPDDAVEDLQEGVDSINQDEEFHEESEEVLEGYEIFTGEELEERIDEAFNISEEDRLWLQEYLDDNYDVDITEL